MKKALIIYSQLDEPKTGGQVIDFEFIHEIESSGCFEMSYFLDSNLKSNSNLAYNVYLLIHLHRFMTYDVIFMNSRTYPQMLFFVLFLRILCFKGQLLTIHHHYNFETSYGWRKIIHRIAELSFLRCMSVLIIPSPFVLDLTKELLPQSDTVYIPIGFKDLGDSINVTENNNHRLLCVGNVDRRKRNHQMIEIAKALAPLYSDLKVDIVGGVLETDYNIEITNAIQSNGLNDVVILHGRVDDATLNKLYDDASIFVFPSSYEGYGMALIEAMSHSLPVVAYNNSAIPYSIKNGYNGFVVEDNNVSLLTNRIKEIFDDKDLYLNLKHNAKEYVCSLPTIDQMRLSMRNYIKTIA